MGMDHARLDACAERMDALKARMDAFEESKHPRAGDGRFGSGGGAAGGAGLNSPHPFGDKPKSENTDGGVARSHSMESHNALVGRGFEPVKGHSGDLTKVEYHHKTEPRHSVSVMPHGGSEGGFMWNRYKGGSRVAGGEGNESLMKHLSRVK